MNVRLYFRQVFVLLFGNVAAQLINLASYPVLTRLYSPADFGGFALFLTAIGILGPIAAARFDLIVQSSKDWQLPAVFAQAQRMNLLIAGIAGALALLYSMLAGGIGPETAVLVAVAVLLSGYTLTVRALLVRNEDYRRSTSGLVARSLVTALAQIGLWYALPTELGLILGFCAGFLVQAGMLHREVAGLLGRRAAPKHQRAVFKRFRRQILTDIPSTMLAALVLNIMTFLVLDLYSREEVGYYSLAFRIAVLPLSLISGSLQEVFYQKASASYRATGRFWIQLRFNIATTTMLSLLIFVPMGLIARPVFAVAFGEQWLPAADLLILLSPMLAVRFVSSSIQTAPLVVGRANWLLAQNIGLLVAITASYALAMWESLPIESYVLLTSLLMALVYACFLLFVALAVRHRYGRARSPLAEGA